jgi:hypothetical protein
VSGRADKPLAGLEPPTNSGRAALRGIRRTVGAARSASRPSWPRQPAAGPFPLPRASRARAAAT